MCRHQQQFQRDEKPSAIVLFFILAKLTGQRKSYRNGKTSKEFIKSMEALGVVWKFK